ncbi:N-6 DNA methylase [uncultured Adlercreutzia sp.]|uniref:N-6 DNA methylase n=1 Tax=uncultured Adlercreutzia sp. TaxID=875803 RepID=UPI002588A9AF|nr:N-6 DNA methylase [uncultured Adlercreutzia sp.]
MSGDDAVLLAYCAYLASEANSASSLSAVLSRCPDKRIASLLKRKYEGNGSAESAIEKMARSFTKEDLAQYIIDGVSHGKYRDMFATPAGLCNLAIRILDIKEGDSVADICCGYGNFIVQSAELHPEASYFGIDISEEAACVAQIRCEILGAKHEIVVEDAFNVDTSRRFDKIFGNFPFGMRTAMLVGSNRYHDLVRSGKEGVGSARSADWLFNKLTHDLLADNGRAVTITANGAAVNGLDAAARRTFIEGGMICAVVALPESLFSYTNIPTVLFVLGRNEGAIRMVDASAMCASGRRGSAIDDESLEMILEAMRADSPFSRLVDRADIERADWSLSPARYLGREIKLVNATPLSKLVESIDRGAVGLNRHALDELATDENTNIRYVQVADVKDGCIVDDLMRLGSLDEPLRHHALKDGDVLVSRAGSPFKVAVAEIVDEVTVVPAGNFFVLRLDQSKIDPYFLAAFLSSDDGQETLERIAGGTTFPTISQRNLEKMKVPVPSPDMQALIAAKFRAAIDQVAALRIALDRATVAIREVYDGGEVV